MKKLSCPICGRPTADPKPFCSPNCARIDLGRWLTGRYILPGEALPAENDDDAG